MRIGLVSGAPQHTLSELVADAAKARNDGMASYWISPDTSVDVLTAIAVIGHSVPDIELGASVDPTFLRHPMLLAMQASTVQQAVNGRLLLNIAPPMPRNRQSFSGYIYEQPLSHTRRVVTVLRQLLKGESLDDQGRSMAVRGRIEVKNVAPPILLSAFKSRMLKFAGGYADGIVTWMVGQKTLASYVVPRVKQAALLAMRPAPRIMAAVAVCVTDDDSTAIEAARVALEDFGALATYRTMLDREGVMSPHDLMVSGDEAQVREGLLKFGEAGATDLLVVELCPDAESARRTRKLLTSIIRSCNRPAEKVA
jgi:5,10-methylenetetrahydromethanopterin reductase